MRSRTRSRPSSPSRGRRARPVSLTLPRRIPKRRARCSRSPSATSTTPASIGSTVSTVTPARTAPRIPAVPVSAGSGLSAVLLFLPCKV
jgi:hypothetical protein